MKVEHTNPNIIVSTSRKSNFKAGKHDALAPLKAIEEDETKYNKAVSVGAIAVLAGLGIAMFHKINSLDIVGKKLLPPKAKQINMPTAHGGPSIDITKGETAIADAWNGYISDIEERVQKKHAQIKNLYNQIFNKNSAQLDKYEAIADERLASNTGRRFVQCA